MKKAAILVFSVLFSIMTPACSFDSSEGSLKPRTEEENQAIRDSWYPVKNSECQTIVDSFELAAAAIGGDDTQYLSQNLDEIRERLEITAEVTSKRLLNLARETNDSSIESYALEAVPIMARLGEMLIDSEADSSVQMDYFRDFSSLTGKVPSGCKS